MAEAAATDAAATVFDDSTPRRSIFKRIWDGLAILYSSKIAMVGFSIVMFWIIVAVFAPVFTDYTPLEQDWKAPNQGPSAQHILGTDELGRDLWSRLIYGARVVLVLMPITEDF